VSGLTGGLVFEDGRANAPSGDAPEPFSLSRAARAERLVAAGRLVLLGVSLAAASLEGGSAPGWDGPTALIAGGLAYACIVAWLAHRPAAMAPQAVLAVHIVDLALFSAIVVTHAADTPFYLCYLFLLLAAALRWHGAGVLWTGLAAGAAFGAINAYHVTVAQDPSFEVPRFLTRSGYLVVAILLLAHLARHQHRLHVELAALARWPEASSDSSDEQFLRVALRHVGTVLSVPRVMLVLDEPEEPWVQVAHSSAERFEITREPTPSADAMIHDALRGTSFFCADARADVNQVIYRSPAGFQDWRGHLLPEGLRSPARPRRLVSCPLRGVTVHGRLFLLDGRRPSPDDLLFAEVAAGMLSTRLDQHRLAGRLRERAVREERGRVSRDLHDGGPGRTDNWRLAIGDRRLDTGDGG
jgi:signal transduction histidine kinase